MALDLASRPSLEEHHPDGAHGKEGEGEEAARLDGGAWAVKAEHFVNRVCQRKVLEARGARKHEEIGRGAHCEAKPSYTMPSNCLGMSAELRVTMESPLTGGLLA